MILAAEGIADLRQALLGQLLGQVHGNLAGQGDLGRLALRVHVGLLDLVVLGHRLLDEIDGDLTTIEGDEVFQRFLHQFQRQG